MGKRLKKGTKTPQNHAKPVPAETSSEASAPPILADPTTAKLPPPPPLSKMKPANNVEASKPFVSILCATYNRRPFIPMFLEMVRNQDYPQSRMEIIIVDDGTDPVEDIITEARPTMPNIRYVRIPFKIPLGRKRNYANSLVSSQAKYVIPMDDDDVMMSERVSHSVETLERNPQAMCAGSSEMFLYFKHIRKLYKFGPYMVSPEEKQRHDAIYSVRNSVNSPLDQYLPIHTNHATNGTFAYRRELIKMCKYNDKACLAEEKEFLKGYTIPMVQLNPFKCILCISHEHNTFDKRKLLENANPIFVSESSRSVDCFFKLPKEAHIKKFFMEDVDALLEKYRPGLPDMKPDVQKQLKELEEERAKMAGPGGQAAGSQTCIVIQQPGQPPKQLTMEEVVDLMRQQQMHIDYMTNQLAQMQEKTAEYRQRILDYMLASEPELPAIPVY